MKRILSLVLALSMVLGMFSFAFAANVALSDIDGQYYQAAVEALVELGVINGNPDGTFKGEDVVTRAQLAKMLVIALGQEQAAKIAKGSTQFTDVAADHWASGYINVAAQSKVIVGYPDGTFLPEEKVSYAEAVTMALRALGYKNVVETTGTWPTNYITKANELQLLKDMKNVDAEAGAKRGNIAILLWNMLRTEMWDIREENQTNGMTYGKTAECMLNIKFPDYDYCDEAYFFSISVDAGKVKAGICKKEIKAQDTADLVAEVEGIDLLRLVRGMKVAYLYNKEDERFLTLTNLDTLVEGTVTSVSTTRFKIDDVEYKGNVKDVAEVNDYVVALVDGKKLVNIVVLPTSSTEVEKIRTMENKIDEEDLVIIDGEWAERSDIKVGDVYTKVEDLEHLDGHFYAVARERENGTFKSFTVTTNKNYADRYSIEVDGDGYTAIGGLFHAYDGEDNDTEVSSTELRKKAKDNKYLDKDVELVFNYVGQVVKMYFGEVKDLAAEGNFYVLTSDGAWYTASSKGREYHVVLAGVDGENNEYGFVSRAAVNGLDNEDFRYYTTEEDFNALFVHAKMNNDEEIKAWSRLEDRGTYDKYTAHRFNTEIDDNNYIDDYKVTASTVVVTVTPVLDDDNNVVDVKVTVSEGTKALDGVTEGILLYETEKPTRAKFVFVEEDAESQELNFGLVQEFTEKKGVQYVTISGETYEVEDEDIDAFLTNDEDEFLVDYLVAFTVTDGKAKVKDRYVAKDIDRAALVTDVDDEIVTVDNTQIGNNGTIDTSVEEGLVEALKKHTVVTTTASIDRNNKVEFEDDCEVLGTGIKGITFKKGDRISISKPNAEGVDSKVVVIIRGLDKDVTFVDGVAQY